MIEKKLEITLCYTSAETVEEARLCAKEQLHIDYMHDVSWTDDIDEWYRKLTANNLETQEDTDKHNAMLLYWKESYQHYTAQKTAVDNATTIENILAISYAPTHSTPRDQIQEM